jgi:hypothetical protein
MGNRRWCSHPSSFARASAIDANEVTLDGFHDRREWERRRRNMTLGAIGQRSVAHPRSNSFADLHTLAMAGQAIGIGLLFDRVWDGRRRTVKRPHSGAVGECQLFKFVGANDWRKRVGSFRFQRRESAVPSRVGPGMIFGQSLIGNRARHGLTARVVNLPFWSFGNRRFTHSGDEAERSRADRQRA